MAGFIKQQDYSMGLDLRTTQALPLFNSLAILRKGDLSSSDRVIDIGCGHAETLAAFWNMLLKKRNIENRPSIVGLDCLNDPSSIDLPKFEYLPNTNINTWQVPSEYEKSFSLATATYSWHWITGENNGEHSHCFYENIAKLLKDEGHLSILHLLTDNPMPEITTIALAAFAESGIPSLQKLTVSEYKHRRQKDWNMPGSLDVIEEYTKPYLKNLFHQKLLLGSTTWHWMEADKIWAFWSSVNLPKAFADLTENDVLKLERAFKLVTSDNYLRENGFVLHLAKGSPSKLYVRFRCHAAQQILQRGKPSNTSFMSKVHIKPDLPQQVHDDLDQLIPEFEKSGLGIDVDKILVLNRDRSQENEHKADPLLCRMLQPVMECISKAVADTYSLNIRHQQLDADSSLGHLRNITWSKYDGAVKDDIASLRNDKVKNPHSVTFSELVFRYKQNPNDILVFSGPSWSNQLEWQHLKNSVAVFWVQLLGDQDCNFHPGSTLCVQYVRHVDGWYGDHDLIDFMKFLMVQINSKTNFDKLDKRSSLFISANRVLGESIENLDSISLTFFQSELQYKNADEFPSAVDCFLIFEALQSLILVRERVEAVKKIKESKLIGYKEGALQQRRAMGEFLSLSQHHDMNSLESHVGGGLDRLEKNWWDLSEEDKISEIRRLRSYTTLAFIGKGLDALWNFEADYESVSDLRDLLEKAQYFGEQHVSFEGKWQPSEQIPKLVRVVFANLIVNAIDQDSRVVVVEANPTPARDGYTFVVRSEPKMTPKWREKAFDKVLDEEMPNERRGLWICRWIVKKCDGKWFWGQETEVFNTNICFTIPVVMEREDEG